jgi:hypothetical protein
MVTLRLVGKSTTTTFSLKIVLTSSRQKDLKYLNKPISGSKNRRPMIFNNEWHIMRVAKAAVVLLVEHSVINWKVLEVCFPSAKPKDFST